MLQCWPVFRPFISVFRRSKLFVVSPLHRSDLILSSVLALLDLPVTAEVPCSPEVFKSALAIHNPPPFALTDITLSRFYHKLSYFFWWARSTKLKNDENLRINVKSEKWIRYSWLIYSSSWFDFTTPSIFLYFIIRILFVSLPPVKFSRLSTMWTEIRKYWNCRFVRIEK